MNTYPGFVYILSNPAFKEDIFKIGHTTRSPSDRAWEIYQNATGVPAKFEVAYARQVANCEQAEERIHEVLKEVRINEYREFFRVSLFQAKEVFEEVCRHVDLECNEVVDVPQKTVIDRIGTRQTPHSSINPDVSSNTAVAHEVTRIRRDNDLKRRELVNQVGPYRTEPASDRSLWIFCFELFAFLLGLFLFMKYLAFPIAASLGRYIGDLFLVLAPLIFIAIFAKISAINK